MTDLSTLTERELYRLAFDISEELTRREMERLCRFSLPDPLVALGAGFDNADDRYGGW